MSYTTVIAGAYSFTALGFWEIKPLHAMHVKKFSSRSGGQFHRSVS